MATGLARILFVLRNGIAWQQLPQELGYGSGMTCWRRLKETLHSCARECSRQTCATSRSRQRRA